jgi:aspartate racemase
MHPHRNPSTSPTPRTPEPLHIGIVGCSAEGAALCYRTLCADAPALLGPHAHPEITLHTPSLAHYVSCLERGDLPGVAALMLASARKLANAGAELLICPDNTIHQAWPWVLPHAPRPWLHIAEVVAAQALARGFRRVGVLGTHWLVASEVYPAALHARGIEAVRPSDADRDLMGRIIMDELVPGTVRPGSVAALQGIVARLAAQGCDAVVLGCTELPLVLDDRNTAVPTLDSTRLLARAALARAVEAQRSA